MADTYLDKIYAARTPEETRDVYDAWSKSYEDEVGKNGYATPGRVAEALFHLCPEPQAPILDFGCGTGLSGLALTLSGFQVIDGMDLSQDMLEQARAKGLYRSLTQVSADSPPPIAPGKYKILTALGVIGAGAAPLALFDTLAHTLTPGDLFAFSFNDHTLDDPAYEARVNDYVDCGTMRLAFRDHGPHLPGIGMKSTIYILEKI